MTFVKKWREGIDILPEMRDTFKYKYMVEQLEKYIPLDEEHGILSFEEIKDACAQVFQDYSVKYCILFGSYAKRRANEKSDVDLLVSTDVTGLRFFWDGGSFAKRSS